MTEIRRVILTAGPPSRLALAARVVLGLLLLPLLLLAGVLVLLVALAAGLLALGLVAFERVRGRLLRRDGRENVVVRRPRR